ncbi:ABC transporter permease [Streptosporangium amethystogenes]|uniref:ABC transporter permease n=1 Tax=Streptosporangium amethystogenes TaxID=2002 RepID=UPI0037989600
MIWLVWRQHRKQALFVGIGLVLIAALMIPTGLTMRSAFVDNGVAACVRLLGDAELVPINIRSCQEVLDDFNNQFQSLATVGVLFFVLPLLVGLFLGAPLVARELEHGTHRLVWTQGVSRRHWALAKFGLVGAATLAVACVYGLGMSWWMAPLSQTGQFSRFNVYVFDMQGLVPIGYTLFAVALGIFAGTVWHKVLPAMAVVLAGFLGLRFALTILARPHYLPAETFSYPVQGPTHVLNPTLGNWVLSIGVRNSSGELVQANGTVECPVGAQGPAGQSCGGGLLGPDAYNWQLYQPGSRYWLFQGIESGIFIALAALLLFLAVRRIRRIA